MLIRESIEKTINFFQKRLVNLKSLLFGGYQKLPKPPLLNPFSCSFGKTKDHQKDHYYSVSCNTWESDLEETKNNRRKQSVIASSTKPVNEQNASSGELQEERKKEEKKMGNLRMDKREDQFTQNLNPEGGYALAQKMKQLDIMDAGDMEHVLDVEEALHYYSRLKSPIYIDIVDKFFVDMYSEFSAPQYSARLSSSKRRLGSIRL